jgi:hypothetical protein
MAEHNPPTDDGDDGEYELEPIDPDILEHERQRGEQKSHEAEAAVDVDQVYRETESDDPITWDDLRGFRFTIRHLMIGTAVVAIVLTLQELTGCSGLFIAFVIALAGGWFFVLRKERGIHRERERRLQELKHPTAGQPIVEAERPVVNATPPFHFSFSLKQVFAALTIAAVTLGLIEVTGETETAAVLLGTIALLGLLVHLFGFEPAPVVVLGWWLLLVLYIAVSLWAILSPTFALSQGP